MSNPAQKPQFSKKFAAGALLVEGQQNIGLLIHLASDYDVLRTQLEEALGRSHTPLGSSPWGEGRCWQILTEKQENYILDTFFKKAVPLEEVRSRPNIEKLRVVPIDLDSPLIANNWGDHMNDRLF